MLKRILITLLLAGSALAQDTADPALTAEVHAVYPQLEKLYLDLHQTPELSTLEANTSTKLAAIVRDLGYSVTDHVGGYGVVAILKNGPGPTVMFRTDMDALPVEEKTGLPYASRVHMKDITGDTVPVMHACGHDIHMSAWIGTATIMAKARDRWSGTLIMVAQPAEERVLGAKAMIKDGLFTRFPKPDFAIGLHDWATMPAGTVGAANGPAMASSDSINLTIYGKGGHGAWPQQTIDPVVIAARVVLALQTLISREKDPIEPGVVTVGAIHGGAKANVIPDQVDLQISVRAFNPKVRNQLVFGIFRIAKAEAAAANAPREPEMKVIESTQAVHNDPKLFARLMPVLGRTLGEKNVQTIPPVTGSEDFSEYLAEGIPGFFMAAGAVPSQKWTAAQGDITKLPSLHSALFAPDYNPTIQTAVAAEVSVLRELLKKQ